MAQILDNASLRGLEPSALAQYLLGVLAQHNEKRVSDELLSAIEQDSIPPTVFHIWLSVTKNPISLTAAIRQEHSVLVRKIGILQFGKALQRKDWRPMWDCLGGVQGLKSLFQQLSVSEVKELAKAIGCCRPRDEAKQNQITKLLQSLLDSGGRPVHHHYSQIVPACNSEYVAMILEQDLHHLRILLPQRRLAQYHTDVLRRYAANAILSGKATWETTRWLPDLSQQVPSIPSDVYARCSSSMEFSIKLLYQLTGGSAARFDTSNLLTTLVNPLLRRALTKKIEMAQIREIVELTLKGLHGNPTAAAHISWDRKSSFLYQIVRCWSLQRTMFEKALVTCIQLKSKVNAGSLSTFVTLLSATERPKRYALLRLLLLHSSNILVDANKEHDLKRIDNFLWPTELFLNLEKQDASALLRGLIRANPDGGFLETAYGNTIRGLGQSPGSRNADPNLLLAYLDQNTLGNNDKVSAIVEQQRGKAHKAREQIDRAFYAKSALFFATASGSPDLYAETAIWMRRFVKDPLTVKTLFAPSSINTEEAISLLSGIGPDDFNSITTAKVRSRVLKANQILLEYMETACMALREPAFYAPDWNGPLTFSRLVVEARLENVTKLQRCLKLSDSDLYDLVWAETLGMLLRAEKVGLQEGHQRLCFNQPLGPLGFDGSRTRQLKHPHPMSYRFLDNLARGRDQLWRDVRPSHHPAAAALELPWPRGLPVQSLAGGHDVATDHAKNQTPFIASRAAGVVFLDSRVALARVPEDRDFRDAIGLFIDSYEVSLQIYVLQSAPGKEREALLLKAWSHATTNLTRSRMEAAEAHRTWTVVFERALPGMKLPSATLSNEDFGTYPLVPQCHDSEVNLEWNPACEESEVIARRQLYPTCLDCFLGVASTAPRCITSEFSDPSPLTEGFTPLGIWSLDRYNHRRSWSRTLQEGMVISAMLYLDSVKGGRTRLLALPFPSSHDQRYPGMFLDPEFLLRKDVGDSQAKQVLVQFLNITPSRLLQQLTSAVLDALSLPSVEASRLGLLEGIAFGLLRLLTASDRPQLASELVVRTIIDRPDASSWHRRLLRKGFVRSLSANEAYDVVRRLADSICAKLQEHARTKPPISTTDTGSSKGPIIKVTTVKYLAQFLDEADYLPADLSLSILSDLLKHASHIDIQTAVVQTILNKLAGCQDDSTNSLAEKLLCTLESTVSIAGSLNERHMMTKEDWTLAKEKGVLPEVYEDGGIEALPPILNLLVTASGNKLMKRSIVTRLLLPIVRQSQTANAEWIQMFCRKHNVAFDQQGGDMIPVKSRLLSQLLERCTSFIPISILDAYQHFVLANMTPSPTTVKINTQIRRDVSLRDSNEGRHWLSIYGHGPAVFKFCGFSLAKLLRRRWQDTEHVDGMTLKQVQSYVFEQAERLLGLGDPNFKQLNLFMKDYEPPTGSYHSADLQAAWLTNCKPVVERIIARVDSLRTSAWQRNRTRDPAVLPSTFALKLWLLPYPDFSQAGSADVRCMAFADRLVKALKDLIDKSITYHKELAQLSEAALRVDKVDDRMRIGCYLGALSPETDLEGLLRVELAGALLETASGEKTEGSLRLKVEAVLDSWKASDIESIRIQGLKIAGLRTAA